MSIQSAINQDAALRSYFSERQPVLVEQKAPVFDFYWKGARTVKVNQKGYEEMFTKDVQLPLQAGRGTGQYPEGATFERDRFKAFPLEMAATYEIDAPTYDDYRAGNKDTYNSLEKDMELMRKEYFKFCDIFMAGDGSGVLGVLGTGSTTTVLVLSTNAAGVHAAGNGVAHLKKNVPYDLYNGSSLVSASIKFDSFDYTNNTGTLTVALGGAPAAGLKLYPASSRNYFFRGLRYGVQNNKDFWQSADAQSNPYVNSMSEDGEGELMDNLAVERILQKQAFRSGIGKNKTFTFWISPSLKSLWKQPGWNLIRPDMGGGKLNTSWADIGYEESQFKEWPNADPDVFIGNDPKNVVKTVQKEIDFFTYEGRIFNQAVGSNGRGEGKMYANFGGRWNFFYESPEESVIGYNYDVSNAVTKSNYLSAT